METNPNERPFQPGDAISYDGKDGLFCEDGRIEVFPEGRWHAAIIEIDGEKSTVPKHKVKHRDVT